MADVLHRVTKEYRRSVNTPDFSVVDWIINPDLTAVAGQPSKYWTITGDVVSLLDQAAQNAVDAAQLDADRDAAANTVDGIESYDRALVKMLIKEINILRADIDQYTPESRAPRTVAQFKTQIRNELDGT